MNRFAVALFPVALAATAILAGPGAGPGPAPAWTKKTVTRTLMPGAHIETQAARGPLGYGFVSRYRNLLLEGRVLSGGTVELGAAWIDSWENGRMPKRHSYAVVGAKPSADNGDGLTPGTYRDGVTVATFDKDTARLVVKRAGRTVFETAENPFALEIIETQVLKDGVFNRVLKAETNFVFRAKNRGRNYGLGGKTGALELTGREFSFWNSDTYKYTSSTDPIYSTFPFVLGVAEGTSWGMFVECMGDGSLSLKDTIEFRSKDRRIDAYVFNGSPKEIVGRFAELTGKPALPPAWALGFHQSRYSYMTQAEVLEVAEKFRAHDLPLDVIHLDIDVNDRRRSFTWNPKTFPDPAAMNATLRAKGVRTVMICDPGTGVFPELAPYTSGMKADVFVKLKPGGPDFIGKVWPGQSKWPDFTRPATRAWWGEQYKPVLDAGVSGIWNDMNEPSVFGGPRGTLPETAHQDWEGLGATHGQLHNVYGLTMTTATRAGLEKLRPGLRPFVLTRAAYPGSQRSAFLWTGDNTADWSHLRMNVTMVLSLGLSGMPFTGADVGGYTGMPDDELMTRWMQLATFVPFSRAHSETGFPRKEPYVFKSVDNVRGWMKLRYTLFPYLYTAAVGASETGLPFFKPLFLEYGPMLCDADDQFLFGDDFLVAPVLEKGAKKRTIILPRGTWYDFKTGEKHRVTGDLKGFKVNVTLADCPVYVRGGALVPMAARDLPNTDALARDRDILVRAWPDEAGRAAGSLYEDDMGTTAYKSGAYSMLWFTYRQQGAAATVTTSRKGDLRFKRTITFQLPEGVTSLTVDGAAVPVKDDKALWPQP